MAIQRFPTARRGSSYSHTLQISVTSGTISGCTLRMMIKAGRNDADAAALISLDNALLGGLTIISATAPITIGIAITDTALAAIPITGSSSVVRLYANIQVELPDGTTEELDNIEDVFLVRSDIVRAVASP
jgi:hypothetical protein